MADDIILQRLNTYHSEHCWQYEMRVSNLQEDLQLLPDGVDYTKLQISDFSFRPLESSSDKQEAAKFIKRHEWLGKLAMHTSHYFGAFYNGVLAGVVTMGVPNAFSKVIGDGTQDVERLISRGACISWSPKGLASHFVMWCIKWAVQNTPYRVFSAYSDPTAKELGTIYQACNFYYIGKSFGGTSKYISPYSGNLVSDRVFRVRSYYKRYAQDLGIEWQDSWSKGDKVYWDNMPNGVEQALKEYGKHLQSTSKKVIVPSKHKYVYILGKDKRETRELRNKFLHETKVFPYPKER